MATKRRNASWQIPESRHRSSSRAVLLTLGSDLGSDPTVELRPPETPGSAQLESGDLAALRQAVDRAFARLQKGGYLVEGEDLVCRRGRRLRHGWMIAAWQSLAKFGQDCKLREQTPRGIPCGLFVGLV